MLLCCYYHTTIHLGDWVIQTAADGRPHFIPPTWIDPAQKPLRNTIHLLGQGVIERLYSEQRGTCGNRRWLLRCRCGHCLEAFDIDGLVICGVELVCCVLCAILGAAERGYHSLVPEHLVSGQDTGDETDDRAVRDWLRYNQPDRLVEDENRILEHWKGRHHE